MEAQKGDILNYYDQLAKAYDQDRFQNSYGNYLDSQERQVLRQWLGQDSKDRILDLGCGTGRLLDFAQYGVDFSENMLALAKEKFPAHQLVQSDITQLPFQDQQFNTIFSFHVFMHLDQASILAALKEVHRTLQDGGQFIVDFPNSTRRKAINYQKAGWHGNTALDLETLSSLLGEQWSIQKVTGFLLFPIHRFPKPLRSFFRPLDSFLCKTFLKHYASYYCVSLTKR